MSSIDFQFDVSKVKINHIPFGQYLNDQMIIDVFKIKEGSKTPEEVADQFKDPQKGMICVLAYQTVIDGRYMWRQFIQ